MSYTQRKTNDSMNTWFSNMSDFMNIVPNLLTAESQDAFDLWCDKLMAIDKRSLVLYIRKNRDRIRFDLPMELERLL